MMVDLATINKSSMMVTVDMGSLNTAPKQAQRIFRLSNTLWMTPMALTPMTKSVATLVQKG